MFSEVGFRSDVGEEWGDGKYGQGSDQYEQRCGQIQIVFNCQVYGKLRAKDTWVYEEQVKGSYG